jgi:fatty acid synthase subunit alpha
VSEYAGSRAMRECKQCCIGCSPLCVRSTLYLTLSLPFALSHSSSLPLLSSPPLLVLRDAPSVPTPMLSVTGLPVSVLSKFIEKTNATFGSSSVTKKLYLSLINGMDTCSVTGHPYSLVNLQANLRAIQADPEENQDRIPFSKRKVKFHMNFLPVSVPFHCPLLAPAVDLIMKDLAENAHLASCGLLELTASHFQGIPVYATNDNTLLSSGVAASVATGAVKSIMHQLVCMQTSQPVQWSLTCRKLLELGVSHVLDFSRGGASMSLGRLTHRNLDGTGVQVLLAATEESDDNTKQGEETNTMNIKGRASYLDLDASAGTFPQGVNWRETFGPKLLRMNDGSVSLRTAYTELLSRPPLFVSGMTPCTGEAPICAAVMNAGYSIELAGGGQHTPALFRARVAAIAASTQPGEGIHVNLLFLNPFLW